MVSLHAIASDPEDQAVAFQWRIYTCTDATSSEGCDLDPFFTGIEEKATFRVPAFRGGGGGGGGGDGGPAVESLRAVLAGRDDRGAASRLEQELILPVLNAPPDVTLRMVSPLGAVVGAPIDVYARYGDADDTPRNVGLAWTVFSPSDVPYTLLDLPPLPDNDPAHLQQGKRFTPHATGNWDVRVVALDGAATKSEQHLIITVVDDAPPCLESWSPQVDATLLPISEPTLIRVIQASDDLDSFPRTLGSPFFGDTLFTWSERIGAGPRRALSAATSGLVFDPQAYAPGTIVELRVEIYDRKHTAIPCADVVPTCSVISRPGCSQRQTWRLEAR
jgi:hypothetical protein